MPLLPPSTFQPPTPSILLLVPPSSPFQWLIRFSIFLLALASLPFLAILTPLSILCLTSSIAAVRQLAPLPIHPDNLPPKRSWRDSLLRGVIAYFLSGCIWSVTGIGTAPEFSHSGSRRLAHIVAWLVDYFGGYGRSVSNLEVTEETIAPFPDELNVGIFANAGLHKPHIEALWLHHAPVDSPATTLSSSSGSPSSQRRVFLFFGGGGYVTGWPLVHPFVFSLTRSFPPVSPQNLPSDNLPAFAVFAPNVRKSLSPERAFPVPVLDGLAAYAHLRSKGYRPEEITLMGDSAGGGLVWSVAAYLAILQESQTGRRDTDANADLGVPGALVLISPWLALPPTTPTGYPDLVNEPQLLNAARCYLARYPLLKHRPDPFSSDLSVWLTALSRSVTRLSHIVMTPFFPWRRWTKDRHHTLAQSLSEDVLQPRELKHVPPDLQSWLDGSTFEQLSSHHPFVSPSTDIDSPFVMRVLDILAKHHTRLFVHCGSAEWFCEPSRRFASAASRAGVETVLEEEEGGYHIESCVMPAELGGAGARLVNAIRAWSVAADNR